jgi:hypothetical protein
MYCGNNRNVAINGNKQLGTRYSCLRKGIGVGLRLPIDNNYSLAYDPIDNTRIYCGNKDILPVDYNRFGNLPECQTKGVGIGKRLRLERNNIGNIRNNKLFLVSSIFLIINITIFLVLYFSKPSFIIDKKTKKIIWKKFILYYSIFVIVGMFLLFLIYK